MSAPSVSSSAPVEGPLPAPLVRPYRHPLRWAWNTAQLALGALIAAYCGVLIVTALYYLLFEVDPTMTRLWHRTITNATIRHDVRNVAEGLLGGLLGIAWSWNHYRQSLRKPPSTLDRLEMRLHIPNVKDRRTLSVGAMLVTVPLVLAYATPGFLAGVGIVAAAHHAHRHLAAAGLQLHVHLAHHQALVDKLRQTWTRDWPKKLIGLAAAFFFGRRSAKAVIDDMQLVFAERRVANGLPLRFYHPPTFKARVNDIAGQGPELVERYRGRGNWVKRLTIASIPVALALAGYGWYILAYVATK